MDTTIWVLQKRKTKDNLKKNGLTGLHPDEDQAEDLAQEREIEFFCCHPISGD
jgi:hypothetical protein